MFWFVANKLMMMMIIITCPHSTVHNNYSLGLHETAHSYKQVYRRRYDNPPVAARCCHVPNDFTNFTDHRQTNEQEDIAIASGPAPRFYERWFNPLDSKGNYSAASNNTKLVHWPLMDGLLHLVPKAPPSPLLAVPNVTAHPSTASTNHCIAIWWYLALRF